MSTQSILGNMNAIIIPIIIIWNQIGHQTIIIARSGATIVSIALVLTWWLGASGVDSRVMNVTMA